MTKRLMAGLSTAVDHYNKGLDPSIAVMKAAEFHGFNPDMTTRLVETFNCARVLQHQKTASDRTTSVKLADADVVLTSLFYAKPQAKAAAVAPRLGAYCDDEIDWTATPAPTEKLASAEADQLSPRARLIEMQREVSAMVHDARDAEERALGLETLCGLTLRKAAEDLTLLWPEQARDRYARTAALLQSEKLACFSEFVACVPPDYRASAAEIAKEASHGIVDATGIESLTHAITEAEKAMKLATELRAISGTVHKAAMELERNTLVGLGAITGKTVVVEKSAADMLSLPENFKKAAGPEGGKGVAALKWLAGPPSKVNMTDSTLGVGHNLTVAPILDMATVNVPRTLYSERAEQNKLLSERLRNTQREVLLGELLTKDPVLADEAPEAVSAAYSALLQFAPEVADNRELARAYLRQAVHSTAVSPFDAELITRLDKNMLVNSGKLKGPGDSK